MFWRMSVMCLVMCGLSSQFQQSKKKKVPNGLRGQIDLNQVQVLALANYVSLGSHLTDPVGLL